VRWEAFLVTLDGDGSRNGLRCMALLLRDPATVPRLSEGPVTGCGS